MQKGEELQSIQVEVYTHGQNETHLSLHTDISTNSMSIQFGKYHFFAALESETAEVAVLM